MYGSRSGVLSGEWDVGESTMRLSAAYGDGCYYRVYDYPAGSLRFDLCWVDDVLNQVGVGHATCGFEMIDRIEQRKQIMIITALKWVALDLPEEEERVEKKISIPELFGLRDPLSLVVR